MKDVDFFTPGARLALELECLLMDTRDAAAQSRWWDSAHEALEQWRQAVRAMEASIDAVQPEASTTLNEAESHARICAKLAEEHKDDVLVCVALTDAAAIIRDLMRDRLGASATGAGHAEIEALRETLATLKAENEKLREALKGADNEMDLLDEEMDTCDHSVGVCMCSYWSMRRKMKAALMEQLLAENERLRKSRNEFYHAAEGRRLANSDLRRRNAELQARVAELAAKWRQRADQIKPSPECPGVVAERAAARAEALRDCADELEAALAARERGAS